MRTARSVTPRGSWRAGLAVFGLVVAALSGVDRVQAGPATTATVQFGNPNAPGEEQNCITRPAEPCASAFHKLIPGSVAISAPGTVDFQLNGRHQVAVYYPGKDPNEVESNDDDGLYIRKNAASNVTQSVTFTDPGRYLVVCNIPSHLAQNMLGWVVVEGD